MCVRERETERDRDRDGDLGRLSPTSMTRCLAVGCRECQCFQNRSCSTGTFSLSKTTITTLCKHSSHCDSQPQERLRSPGHFPEPKSHGPAPCLSFPHLRAVRSYPTAPSPWGLWQAGLAQPFCALLKLLLGQCTLTLLEDKARPLLPAGVRRVTG